MSKGPSSTSTAFLIRLSPPQIRLVRSGLNWIANNYQVRLKGRVSTGQSFGRVWKRNFDPGVYNQQLMDDVLAVRARVTSLSNSNDRLRFTSSFQVAACALAVRIALKRHRHGHNRLDIPSIRPVAKRLLTRLEVVRKRAKRAEVRRYGKDGYRQKAHDWQRFVTWLRVHVANCGCIPRFRRESPSRRSERLDIFVEWTKEELADRKEQVPDNKALRQFVRELLASVSRDRTTYTVRDLLDDKVFAASRFANFVTSRMEKASARRKG
jgi:hypothetical protein